MNDSIEQLQAEIESLKNELAAVIEAASLHHSVLVYIYGHNDDRMWERLVKEQLIPPLPLSKHLYNQGFRDA